jgi:hypothetical protein
MKVENWWANLCTYVAENSKKPREYGVWDCWQFVGGAVLVTTGVDHRSKFKPYRTLEEGVAVLEENGGPAAMLTTLFGPAKPVSFAQRGDIVICDLGEGPAAGICFGVDTMTISPAGIESVRTLEGTLAWTVS